MPYKLNSVLRGWIYAHRKVVVKEIFSFIDNNVFKQVANWLRKEHRNKNGSWIDKACHKQNKRRFSWGSHYVRKEGEVKWVELFRMADVPVRYHTKIRSEGNPMIVKTTFTSDNELKSIVKRQSEIGYFCLRVPMLN